MPSFLSMASSQKKVVSDIENKLLFFLPIVEIQLSFETIQELISTKTKWLCSKSNYIIYKISKQQCWQSIYKRRMRSQSTHKKTWQQEADGWMDVYHIKYNVGELLIINYKNNDGQLINMLKSISSKADNSSFNLKQRNFDDIQRIKKKMLCHTSAAGEHEEHRGSKFKIAGVFNFEWHPNHYR